VAVPLEIRVAKALALGRKNLKKLLGVRKNRSSSSPTVALIPDRSFGAIWDIF
jgi:hypothetical protein